MAIEALGARLPARYLELISELPLRPLRSEEDLRTAIKALNRLAVRDDLDPDERDYLDVLSDLVEKYEDEHDPMGKSTAAEMLAYLMEEARCVSRAEVSVGTGIPDDVLSEILDGRRTLDSEQIKKLASYFHVNPAVFLDD